MTSHFYIKNTSSTTSMLEDIGPYLSYCVGKLVTRIFCPKFGQILCIFEVGIVCVYS